MTVEIKIICSSSSGNCSLLDNGRTKLLVECGIPFRRLQLALDFGLSAVDGCLVTHEHLDHSKSAKELMRAGIDCYMSAGTAEEIGAGGHRLKVIKHNERFIVGSWTVLPFSTVHDCAESLGFLLVSGKEKILFLTDSAYIPWRFSGLTRIMVECNYDQESLDRSIEAGTIGKAQVERLKQTHFGLENVIEFLKCTDMTAVKEIHLLHLSNRNANQAKIKEAVQKSTGKPVYIWNG